MTLIGFRERLLTAGYKEGYKVDPHPYRKLICFIAADASEWEIRRILHRGSIETDRLFTVADKLRSERIAD